MSHTTRLSQGWIAIHDGRPDEVIFREREGEDFVQRGVIPYAILKEFVAIMFRDELVRQAEEADDAEVLAHLAEAPAEQPRLKERVENPALESACRLAIADVRPIASLEEVCDLATYYANREGNTPRAQVMGCLLDRFSGYFH